MRISSKPIMLMMMMMEYKFGKKSIEQQNRQTPNEKKK